MGSGVAPVGSFRFALGCCTTPYDTDFQSSRFKKNFQFNLGFTVALATFLVFLVELWLFFYGFVSVDPRVSKILAVSGGSIYRSKTSKKAKIGVQKAFLETVKIGRFWAILTGK